MKLLVIRHAPAKDRRDDESEQQDAQRRLTSAGKRRMRHATRGLRRIVDMVDVVVSSPLERASETGQILADAFEVKLTHLAELAPARKPTTILAWLRRQKDGDTVAIVGHEPSLGRLVTWLLTGLDDERSIIAMKKASMCMLEFPDRVGPGRAQLRWFLTAGQLCDLGR